MKVQLLDLKNGEHSLIGVCELAPGVPVTRIYERALEGYLRVVDVNAAAAAARETEKNEERARARQAAMDARDSAVAPGTPLGELRPKQLKALCEARDLPTYGTRHDLLGRLEEYERQQEALKAAAAQLREEEVNLDALTVDELKQVAKGYGVSVSGKKEEIIGRILEAAAKAENGGEDTPGDDAGGDDAAQVEEG